jgi:hypothetical protein
LPIGVRAVDTITASRMQYHLLQSSFLLTVPNTTLLVHELFQFSVWPLDSPVK